MELAKFLCIFEVLLGILCVSIPMLRPVYARLRTKPRPETCPSGSNTYDLEAIYKRPKKSFGGKLGLQDPTLNTHGGNDCPESAWEMKDYHPGWPKVGHDGIVSAKQEPEEDHFVDTGGSEENLTHKTGIQVERKWTFSRN